MPNNAFLQEAARSQMPIGRSRLARSVVFGLAASLSLAAPLSAMAAGNNAPVAVDDTFTVPNHTFYIPWKDVLVNDNDADVGVLTLSLKSVPKHGIAQAGAAGGAIQYVPIMNYTGLDSFTYVLTDQDGNVSAPATIQLTVVDHHAPTAMPSSSPSRM